MNNQLQYEKKKNRRCCYFDEDLVIEIIGFRLCALLFLFLTLTLHSILGCGGSIHDGFLMSPLQQLNAPTGHGRCTLGILQKRKNRMGRGEPIGCYSFL